MLDTKFLKTVVFDWDNTLAVSKPALLYSVNRVLEIYHMPSWDILQKECNPSLSFFDNFHLIFKQNATEAYEKYRQIYIQNVPDIIKKFPFTDAVLNFFKKRSIPICLMTNKDRFLLEYELPILFEFEMFDKIVCGHEAEHNKPSQSHLFKCVNGIIKSCDICQNSVWIIGDSPQDSNCAKACHAKAIRIGKDLWSEDNINDPDILYYHSFVDFYIDLLSSQN